MSQQSEATENYLKAVLQLKEQNGDQAVRSGEIAKRVGVAPATATLMLKRLAESGLVNYEAYAGVALTSRGKSLALQTVRRHRLIELFLVKTLGMPWDQVHEEAERLEHAVSNRLIELIDEFLGRPEADPHGAPIPRDDGSLPTGSEDESVSLSNCPKGTRFVLRRVQEQSPEFLRYLTDAGLGVGAKGRVAENCEHSGVLRITIRGTELVISQAAAESLIVDPAKG